MLEITRHQTQHRCLVGARRMTHQHNAGVISTEFRGVVLNPGEGACPVLDKGGEFHRRIQAVVGENRHKPALSESGTYEAVVFLVTTGPCTSVPEHNHG